MKLEERVRLNFGKEDEIPPAQGQYILVFLMMHSKLVVSSCWMAE